MYELIQEAKQSASKITDEIVKNTLLKAIELLEKKEKEFLLDVDDKFVTLEQLLQQLDEIPTLINDAQKKINDIILVDTTDTRSKRNAVNILTSFLGDQGVDVLRKLLKEKRQPKNDASQSAHTASTHMTDSSVSTSQPGNVESQANHEIFAKRLKSALDEELNKLELIQQPYIYIRMALKKLLEDTKQELARLEKMLQMKDNPSVQTQIPVYRRYVEQKFNSAYEAFAREHLTKTSMNDFEVRYVISIREAIQAVFKLPSELTLSDLKHEAREGIFDESLNQFLQKLKSLTVKYPSCFVSYAWGNVVNEQVVHTIAKRLVLAGINAVLDIWHNRTDSILQFTERTKKEDFVLVMGSQLLRQKYENPGPTGSFVQQELKMIGSRMKERPSSHNVLKVLIENPATSAFPEFLCDNPHAEADFTNQLFYYKNFFNLLELLYVSQAPVLEILKQVKLQFEKESKALDSWSMDQLKNYLNKEPTAQEQAAIQQSLRDKLQKISTNRAGFFAPATSDGASAIATPHSFPSTQAFPTLLVKSNESQTNLNATAKGTPQTPVSLRAENNKSVQDMNFTLDNTGPQYSPSPM